MQNQTQTPTRTSIKASHRAIAAYRERLANYDERAVAHETGRRFAFQALLEDTARLHHWDVTAEVSFTRNGKTIRPDAVLTKNAMPRGYWEAKDPGDDLDAEIRKKLALGYPATNIIFEDSRHAALFQGGREVGRFDLGDPNAIADLLNTFYGYTEPDILGFDQALDAFKARVPELSKSLQTLITETRRQHADFATAADAFLALLQRAINPDIARAEVEEMLVQHLLTERLIRKLFNNPDFARRNAIAAEIEKVIDALTRHSFSREDYLRDLDRYYVAIEQAAHGLDFREKQGVLNVVYETFFQGFSEKQADTHGIVYTPQPIVDFMCDSVVEALRTEFNLQLDSPAVQVLDPATGTGNFIVHLLDRLPATTLPEVYAGRLFANEILLMPYYIAALNIEHAYFERTGQYEPFQGLCYVDTLSLEHGLQRQLTGFSEENDRRVQRQGEAPITVIIGNPPYNVGQKDENDNNANRPYPKVDGRIKTTYAKDSRASNKNALYDAYVKFFRWASDRLQGRDGIVCYVTNNSFVNQIAFDGMRKHLLQDFTQVYHVDLGGNSRKTARGESVSNVFDIRVGVGITVAIRHITHTERKLFYFNVPESGHKEQKFMWLREKRHIGIVEWQQLSPDSRNQWLITENADAFSEFMPIGDKDTKATKSSEVSAVFKIYGRGVATSRDDVVYDFAPKTLVERMGQFVEAYNLEVDRYKRAKAKSDSKAEKLNIDDFVDYSRVKWSESLKANLVRQRYAEFEERKIRISLYRPFVKRYLYFDGLLNERQYQLPQMFPTAVTEQDNRVIIVSDIAYRASTFSTLISNCIPDLHLCATLDSHQCFPFYTYDPDGTNRRENVTDWALAQFRAHYGDQTIGKWDIFYYVYGALHRPAYRVQFADALKRELPRIPYVADFWTVSKAGKQLADLHLGYESVAEWPLEALTPGQPSPPAPLPQERGEPDFSPSPFGRGGWGVRASGEEVRVKALVSKVMSQVGRELRQRQTDAELLLWEHIRDRRLAGLKFRRQHPIPDSTYVADFYCHESRLVIELDGPIHDQQQLADAARQQDIESLGYHVIRFSNAQLFNDLETVLTAILDAHRALLPSAGTSLPSPAGEGSGVRATPLSYRVADKMRLSRDKTEITVNPSLTLRGIPAEAFEYKLGNRSALEWVIDQYQVKGASDPNRADDERYIVKLVSQVIRVSVETVGIVKGLG